MLLLIAEILNIVPLILNVWSNNCSKLEVFTIFKLYGADANLATPLPDVDPEALNCVPTVFDEAPTSV